MLFEDDLEFIEDDDELLDTGSVSLHLNHHLIEQDHSPEDLERITADIKAHHAGSHAECHLSDDDSI